MFSDQWLVCLDQIFTSILFRSYGVIQTCLRWITRPLFLYSDFRSERKYPPPIDDPILTKSATYIAKKIRTGQLKSEDVVKAFIKRTKEVNVFFNAVVEDRFDDALKEARNVDQLIASHKKTVEQLEKETPFLGVPVTIKESCKLKGMSFCIGAKLRRGFRAEEDGEAVKNIKRAGAIPTAITTTPEWCMSYETDNLVTGKTLNPYDPARTPGGSSGGEAALISSGASIIGVGSDNAGSIRIPALFTSIFGHKPTPGYTPIEGHFPMSSDEKFKDQLVIGPLCRYAEDLVPMVKALAGDKASLLRLDEEIDVKNIRILYAVDAGNPVLDVPVDNEIKEALLKAVDYLKDTQGATTSSVRFKELENSMEICLCILLSLTDLPPLLEHPQDPEIKYNAVSEILKAVFGRSEFSRQSLCYPICKWVHSLLPETSTKKYIEQGQILKKKFIDALGTDGVFLYPTYSTCANYHNEFYFKMTAAMYSMIFSMIGMPATQVPLGIGESGLPVGIQVVAAPHQDRLCLAVARILERGFGGWVPPPSSSIT